MLVAVGDISGVGNIKAGKELSKLLPLRQYYVKLKQLDRRWALWRVGRHKLHERPKQWRRESEDRQFRAS